MIARPAAVALGCRGCQKAIYKAVLSSASTIRTLPPPQSAARQLTRVPDKRLLSSQRKLDQEAEKEDGLQAQEVEKSQLLNEAEDQPWFLEVDPPRHPASQHVPNLPKTPDGAPALIEPMIKYVYEDMGLDDISMLDLRDLESPAALGPNLIMLFATARSERHLHVSAGRFVRWLRRNHKVSARADGLIGPGELKTKLRRLRKKAKLMGTNASILPGGDNGISTGWVCVNFGTNDGSVGEAEAFDEEGRLSGFGAPQTTTTVVVQCMTESRREELDLETLWQGVLRRSLQQSKKIRGEDVPGAAELEAMVASRVQTPTPATPSGLQWQALKQASQQQQQQRHYSTQARRLYTQSSILAKAHPSKGSPSVSETTTTPVARGLEEVRQEIENLEIKGLPLRKDQLSSYISEIFQSPSITKAAAGNTLQLLDRLLRMAEERGMNLWSTDVLVNLIEGAVRSPAPSTEMRRAQTNLEFLLLEKKSALSSDQALRLMAAYAYRAEWDRFWDVFRHPARFQIPRPAEMYELVYRTMASTGDWKLCADALRWVYPEMLQEQPSVLPVGRVYGPLKACILVADPGAQEMLQRPPPASSMGLLEQRRLKRRHFVNMLRDIEEMRRHHAAMQAREERARPAEYVS